MKGQREISKLHTVLPKVTGASSSRGRGVPRNHGKADYGLEIATPLF